MAKVITAAEVTLDRAIFASLQRKLLRTQ